MLRRVLNSISFRPVLMAGFLVTGLWGQEEQGRGVARISLIRGEVSVRRGDSGDWIAAARNAPLVVQDSVLTAASSQAEVQLDYANFIRMASNSELNLAELDNNRYILQIASGTVTYRVLRESEAEVEVSTPSVSIRPVKRGTYRIAILPDGSTEITVRSGEIEIFTPKGSERLKAGRTMLARGGATDSEFQLTAAIPKDDWDRWNEDRDRELERSTSYRYVNPSIPGAEDLDANGTWVDDPSYGNVWAPTVAPGWAPYQDGRWSWVDYYGWSWVSNDPWGWAPYHYGRWFMGTRGWCWWPGAFRSRHYWSPGLVAFVGFGGGGVGVSIGSGWGHVGWVPLAPHETYYPWYGSRYYAGFRNRGGYGGNVNIINNVNITNVYRNARVRNGITAINAGDFTSGRGSRNSVRLSEGEIQRANLVRGQMPMTPERSAQRFTDRDVSGPARGASNGNTRFFSRRTPTAPDRVSFDDQRRGVEELSRRTFGDRANGNRSAGAETARPDTGRGNTNRSGAPAGRNVETDNRGFRTSDATGRAAESRSSSPVDRSSGRPADGRSNDNGWRRFGDPGGSQGMERVTGSAGSQGQTDRRSVDTGNRTSSGGWRRFGDPGDGGSRQVDSSRPPEGNRDGANRNTDVNRMSAPERRTRQMDPAPSNPRSESGNGIRARESSGWQRFGDPGSGGRSVDSPRRESPQMQMPRMETPRQETPRREAPAARPARGGSEQRSTDRGGGEPLRLSPSIVRERTSQRQNFGGGDSGSSSRSPRFESRSSGFGGGGRMESAPRSGGGFSGGGRMQSAPRSSGGGGFNGGGGGRGGGSNGGRGGGRSR